MSFQSRSLVAIAAFSAVLLSAAAVFSCASSGETGSVPVATAAPAASTSPAAPAASTAPASLPGGYELVFSDEFDGPDIDPNNWNFLVLSAGSVNHELQRYTDTGNAWVDKGCLVIEARPDPDSPGEYTSARLDTQIMQKWLYGRIEVRAKLPAGKGLWPAIWLLPNGEGIHDSSWPGMGEIDIMENVGFEGDTIHASLHSRLFNHTWKDPARMRTSTTLVKGIASDFHVYGMEWTKEGIDFFVDDKVYYSPRDDGKGWESWPFDRPFYMILNLAVGGDWGGTEGVDPAAFPARMLVDYVRVYQKPADRDRELIFD